MFDILLISALCLVAYLIGVRRRQSAELRGQNRASERVRKAAKELNEIAQELNARIREHQSTIGRFHRRVTDRDPIDVQEVEKMLGVIRELVSDLNVASTKISEHSDPLKSLTESRIDPLTEVANRLFFEEELKRLLQRSQRTGQTFALALLDVDHFKAVNDSYGHPAGDLVLRHIANVMVKSTREADLVTRIGGDEFAILMPGSELDGAGFVIERIRARLGAGPVSIKDHTVHVSLTVGLVIPRPGELAEALIERADAALYEAKRRGRDRVCTSEHEEMSGLPLGAGVSSGAGSALGNGDRSAISGNGTVEGATDP